jgi:hypothetical protein
LTDKQLALVKYFISSNTALTQLQNPHLLKILDKSIEAPSYHSFRNTFLSIVMNLMRAVQNEKLQNANAITLIVDMWTSKNNKDFIVLGSATMDDCFEREIMVLDMMRMTTNHTAEHVKECCETMVNKFDFDKSKINCNFYFKNLITLIEKLIFWVIYEYLKLFI